MTMQISLTLQFNHCLQLCSKVYSQGFLRRSFQVSTPHLCVLNNKTGLNSKIFVMLQIMLLFPDFTLKH